MNINMYRKSDRHNWILIKERQDERGFDHYLLYLNEYEMVEKIIGILRGFNAENIEEYLDYDGIEKFISENRQEFGNTVQYKIYDMNNYGDIHIMAALTDLKM